MGVGVTVFPSNNDDDNNNNGTGGFPTDPFTVSLSGGRTFGKYASGQTAPAFQNADELLGAFKETIAPTIASNRSLSLTGAPSLVEVGTRIIAQLSRNFNRGSIDSKNNAPNIPLVGASTGVLYGGPGVNTATGAVSAVATLGTMTWSVIESHAAGTGDYYDSDGNAASNLDGSRAAGSVSDTTKSTVRSRIFSGTGSAFPTTSAQVRSGNPVWDNVSSVTQPTGTTDNHLWFAIRTGIVSGNSISITDLTYANATIPYPKVGTVSVLCGISNVSYDIFGLSIQQLYNPSANHKYTL